MIDCVRAYYSLLQNNLAAEVQNDPYLAKLKFIHSSVPSEVRSLHQWKTF